MEVTVMDILAARDMRAAVQKRLLEQFSKPLVCFTMNIAGPVKFSPAIVQAYELGKRLLMRRIHPVHFEESLTFTGCEGFFVADMDAQELKAICVAIEDSQPVCRLFDMDVLTPDRKLSREELGLMGRTCLLCGKPAHQCSSTRAHTVEQLQEKTAALLETADEAAFTASLAYQALVQEVRTTPKPGLVDTENNGSHKDMDLNLFLKSAAALRGYFYQAAKASDFGALRQAGIEAEKTMLEATGGVNTHKGAVFSLGILCAAAGRTRSCDADTLLSQCAQMTQGICARELGTGSSNGQALYAKYGTRGIRGQAEAGFPAVKTGLKILESGLTQGFSINESGCAALLHMLLCAEDTNLLHRSEPETCQNILRELADLLAQAPYPTKDQLEALDAAFIRKNLSHGGSADLLALAYFLHLSEQNREKTFYFWQKQPLPPVFYRR